METQMVQFSGGAAVERRGVCRVCHRALKNPKWAALGIGPVCAGKAAGNAVAHPLERSSPAPGRSDWRVVKSDAEQRIVWIVDQDRGSKSVTNDADGVVADLAENYPGYRIIYRDSMGNWDELKHDGAGKFTGYASARHMAP